MRGIYFWGVWYADGANAVLTTPDPSLAQEIQPASAAVIKHCYTGNSEDAAGARRRCVDDVPAPHRGVRAPSRCLRFGPMRPCDHSGA